MAFSNSMSRTVDKIDRLPSFFRAPVRSFLFGRVVPFTGTAGLTYRKVTPEEVIIEIKNKRKNQNHIKGVHATAMALIAETATGFVVGMNIPDDKLPLMKSLKVSYLKRTKGDMKAVATLTEEQVASIRNDPKGDVTVPVSVTDETGEEPVSCEMVWAWVPKKKKE